MKYYAKSDQNMWRQTQAIQENEDREGAPRGRGLLRLDGNYANICANAYADTHDHIGAITCITACANTDANTSADCKMSTLTFYRLS